MSVDEVLFPVRGDLRVVGGERLAVVLRVFGRVCEVALVHPYVELATSADGVVSAALARTPFDVVVQCDLRGVVWVSQLASRRVGYLGEEVLGVVSDLVLGGRPGVLGGVWVGVPLVGRWDRRWSFKVGEGEALSGLCWGATVWALGGVG